MNNKLKGKINFGPISLKERLFLYCKAQKVAIEDKYCNVCEHYMYDETQSMGMDRGACDLGLPVTVLFEEKSHTCEAWEWYPIHIEEIVM